MIEDEERFDPSRHSLADAAKRLKQIGEKDYTARLADVLRRHEEENVNELRDAFNAEQGGFEQVWLRTLIREEVHRALYPSAETANPHEHAEDSPEVVHSPTEEQLTESLRNWKPTITFAPPALTEDRAREIFREEMREWEKSLVHRVRMSSPTR